MSLDSDDARFDLYQRLVEYRPEGLDDPSERTSLRRILQFVRNVPACFQRSEPLGHVTGSAWVVDQAREQVVLLHHRKLGLWLQPGGHADGNPNVAEVALKEATEETGLTGLSLASPDIFDLDVHAIPARKGDRPHFHYDVRFLVVAPRTATGRPPPLQLNHESEDGQWLTWQEAQRRAGDRSVLRMIRKSYSG